MEEICGYGGERWPAYSLQKSVKYHRRKNAAILVLPHPLKAMRLHVLWVPVLERLSGTECVALEDIMSILQTADTKRIESFLNDLVHEGFLEQKGRSWFANYPCVSVIIPVRNRPAEIAECLRSMSKIDYPTEKLETIVVDDCSNDNTPQVISGFPVNIIRLNENRQASVCRNLAAQQASGEILAFIDSDCQADPLWLRELVPGFRDETVGAVGGMVEGFCDERNLDRYEQVKSSLNMGPWFKRSHKGNHLFYMPSCNLLVRKNLFLRLGGFREELHVGEDVDLCWRIQDGGYLIEYRPVGKVYHRHRNKLNSFCSRRFEYGTSEPLLQCLHFKRTKLMVFPPGPSLFWGFALLSLVLGNVGMLALCGIVILVDCQVVLAKIYEKRLPMRFLSVIMAIFRSYFAFLYHFCAFVSRYYLIWSAFCFPVWPKASLSILGMHFLTGITDYFVRKPKLNAVTYLFFFSLEQFSYQLGVWKGCLRTFNFNPVNPKIAMGRDFK